MTKDKTSRIKLIYLLIITIMIFATAWTLVVEARSSSLSLNSPASLPVDI